MPYQINPAEGAWLRANKAEINGQETYAGGSVIPPDVDAIPKGVFFRADCKAVAFLALGRAAAHGVPLTALRICFVRDARASCRPGYAYNHCVSTVDGAVNDQLGRYVIGDIQSDEIEACPDIARYDHWFERDAATGLLKGFTP